MLKVPTPAIKPQPRPMNLAKDIKELAEIRISVHATKEFVIGLMKLVKDIILHCENDGIYLRKSLNDIRKLLLKLPKIEVDWFHRSEVENEIFEKCLALRTRTSKIRKLVTRRENESLAKEVCYLPMCPGEYVQVAINFEHKIRCIVTNPNNNAAEIVMEAKEFKRMLLNFMHRINKGMSRIKENSSLVIKLTNYLRKIIMCLALDALPILQLKDPIIEVKSLLESHSTTDSVFKFKIKRVLAKIDYCMGECDKLESDGNYALESLSYKASQLDKILKESRPLMWPWIGKIQPKEYTPNFKCTDILMP